MSVVTLRIAGSVLGWWQKWKFYDPQTTSGVWIEKRTNWGMLHHFLTRLGREKVIFEEVTEHW